MNNESSPAQKKFSPTARSSGNFCPVMGYHQPDINPSNHDT